MPSPLGLSRRPDSQTRLWRTARLEAGNEVVSRKPDAVRPGWAVFATRGRSLRKALVADVLPLDRCVTRAGAIVVRATVNVRRVGQADAGNGERAVGTGAVVPTLAGLAIGAAGTGPTAAVDVRFLAILDAVDAACVFRNAGAQAGLESRGADACPAVARPFATIRTLATGRLEDAFLPALLLVALALLFLLALLLPLRVARTEQGSEGAGQRQAADRASDSAAGGRLRQRTEQIIEAIGVHGTASFWLDR